MLFFIIKKTIIKITKSACQTCGLSDGTRINEYRENFRNHKTKYIYKKKPSTLKDETKKEN
jgi:hypothetical protein